MANILLVDDNEVAGRAMRGILARGGHTCFEAATPEDAWKLLREGVLIDLVFVELQLPGGGGLSLLQRMRDDWLMKILPAVVYTHDTDAKQVRRALGLKVQNYLIKPYNDQLIYAEVAKVVRNPWRNLHFEEAKSFCALMQVSPDTLRAMRRKVMEAYGEAAQQFPAWADQRQNEEVFSRIEALVTAAESAGVWAGVDYLRHLKDEAALGNWSAFKTCGEPLDFTSRLIFCQLNPSAVPECLRDPHAEAEAKEASERARWEHADVDANGAMLDFDLLRKQIDALPGCPVIDTTAAAFQMVADGRASRMSQVMDLVATDPGLSAQVLAVANHTESDDMSSVEDPRAAASLLGEVKLNALAKILPTAKEKHLDLPPLNWPSYWMFQVAVGRVSQFICKYLEFEYLAPSAYTAGLLHDIGKLLLLKLHPFGLQAIIRYSRERKVSLQTAEAKHLGCTTRDLGVHFATTKRLPPAYANAIRWIDTPQLATEHTDLIAMVSLARHICLHAHVGFGGDTAVVTQAPIRNTLAWQVLQPRLFPSFDAKKFEVQAHAHCLTLRSELSGNHIERRPSHAQRSAELV